MPMPASLVVGGIHFVEDNLHFPGEKKVSAGGEKVIGRRQSRYVEHI